MNVDEVELPEGGREFERSVQCAWCASPSVAVVELGGPKGRLDIVYGCDDCKRPTLLLVPFQGRSNKVYVVRAAKRITLVKGKRVEMYYRTGRDLPDWHNVEPDDVSALSP